MIMWYWEILKGAAAFALVATAAAVGTAGGNLCAAPPAPDDAKLKETVDKAVADAIAKATAQACDPAKVAAQVKNIMSAVDTALKEEKEKPQPA
jgi:hypothetical protein